MINACSGQTPVNMTYEMHNLDAHLVGIRETSEDVHEAVPRQLFHHSKSVGFGGRLLHHAADARNRNQSSVAKPFEQSHFALEHSETFKLHGNTNDLSPTILWLHL